MDKDWTGRTYSERVHGMRLVDEDYEKAKRASAAATLRRAMFDCRPDCADAVPELPPPDDYESAARTVLQWIERTSASWAQGGDPALDAAYNQGAYDERDALIALIKMLGGVA